MEQVPPQVTHTHRSALASLKLAIYAVDVMRVLRRIEQQSAMSPDFEAAVRAACPDWRNPGFVDEPEDLLVSVLTYAADALGDLVVEPETVHMKKP